ncbi:hypothetical protein FIBSPDRAFT_892925 [Athelia psychrophila]|uniref:Uncharacterized protein n=1 Tax=Athelia psychrophila TaxID=1759441 RepID=A0A166HQC8_9AGAM|nr:hypothetical protein FIBSPDRAFT_892925 [Fibularhizoctonia sp. CBS 109695]
MELATGGVSPLHAHDTGRDLFERLVRIDTQIRGERAEEKITEEKDKIWQKDSFVHELRLDWKGGGIRALPFVYREGRKRAREVRPMWEKREYTKEREPRKEEEVDWGDSDTCILLLVAGRVETAGTKEEEPAVRKVTTKGLVLELRILSTPVGGGTDARSYVVLWKGLPTFTSSSRPT